MWWLFSCFKSDPSKTNDKTAKKDSELEEEDHIPGQGIENDVISKDKEDEDDDIAKAIEESLKPQDKEDEDDDIVKAIEESLKPQDKEDEDDDIVKAIEESLKPQDKETEVKEEQRRLEESKEKGKRKQVDDKRQMNHSKDLTPPSICNGCKTEIEDGISINAFDALWHPKCLCCLYCHQPIDVHENSKLKQQFHKPCYKEHCHPNCYICEKKLPRTEEGIKYHEHHFWKEKYCPSHDDEVIAKCCSCERLESYGTTYVMLEDRRRLCCQCMECAVMDTYECVSLHIDIREFFESLNMKVVKEFPLLLVEKEALNKAEEEEKIDNQYGIVTRGICLFEEQMVSTITKRPRMGPNKQLIDMVKEPQTVSGSHVTAILILYGLPRLLTGYILAHEMMHAWLRLNGYRNLDIVLEEGLCQVLAYMWLEPQKFATPDVTASTAAAAEEDLSSASSSSRTPPAATTSKKGDQSDFEKRLVDFCKNQIETDDSPVYGVGYKKVYKMMLSNNHNIKDTLRNIVNASKTTPA